MERREDAESLVFGRRHAPLDDAQPSPVDAGEDLDLTERTPRGETDLAERCVRCVSHATDNTPRLYRLSIGNLAESLALSRSLQDRSLHGRGDRLDNEDPLVVRHAATLAAQSAG